jgi:hypothetical protein
MSEAADILRAERDGCATCEHASGFGGEATFAFRPPVATQKPARLVVIGEFNSGKTSLINTLLGTPVLPASFTTHTGCPTVIGYSARRSLSAEMAGRRRIAVAWDRIDAPLEPEVRRLHVGLPWDRLRMLRLVDTPGLGLDDEHTDAQALRACHGADAVVWCTPAMQAWKASEQRAWLSLPRRVRERGILAVTFSDTIRSEADAARLLARLRAEAGPYFRDVAISPALDRLVPVRRPASIDLGAGARRRRPTMGTVAGLTTAELR